jgi:L-seryl-tRNA(Ser) seleniumtransferase
MSDDLRRQVPAVERVLQRPAVQELAGRHGRGALLRCVRALVEELRERAAAGDEAGLRAALERLDDELGGRLARAARPSLRPVINATGVVVHTNLGRAPLSQAAAARVARIAASYSNLEFDLETGQRGDREVHAEGRLRELLGAQATLVVNNNAAAVFLAVNTLAEGREVIVSRGELVEIGGSFRVPDVLRKGGARLVEVGTTNRTRLADYRAALSPATAMILKVHPSNFEIVGFTEAAPLAGLVELAREAGVPLVEDLGSGLLQEVPEAVRGEPDAPSRLAAGVDLVTFSGDKLLGGPQAGLCAGRRELVEAMRRNPLYRALRVDKMTLAALDEVLCEHQAGRAGQAVPVHVRIGLSREALRERSLALAARLRELRPELRVEVIDGASAVGGGAAPSVQLPTALLAVEHPRLGPDALAAALRGCDPPVVARIGGGRLLLDLRCVGPDEVADLLAALATVDSAV